MQNLNWKRSVPFIIYTFALSLLFIGNSLAAPDERAVVVKQVENPAIFRNTKDNWGIFIGVNKFYDDSVTPLNYCASDARALYEKISGKDALIPPAQAYILTTDEDAERIPSRRNILKVVDYVCDNADKDSLIIISISTHGFTGEDGKAYILPVDGDPGLLKDTAVSVDRLNEMLQKSKASKKILFVDACRDNPVRGSRSASSSVLTDQFKKSLLAGEGQMTLASCGIGEVSYEDSNKGHGVFTYYLLEGLGGKAHANPDGFITLYTLFQYANRKTEQWCKVNLKDEQNPWLMGSISDDIPLAIKMFEFVEPETATADVTPPPKEDKPNAGIQVIPTKTPEPTPTPQETPSIIRLDQSENFTQDLGGGVKLEMVYIPGGTFTMGCNQDPEALAQMVGGRASSFGTELPTKKVTLSPYWIGKFEITNEQYRVFKPEHDSGSYYRGNAVSLNDPKQPVVRIRWDDAVAYCEWLSKISGKKFRLPTEAQWEFAAKAGAKDICYWGNEYENLGQYENLMDLAAREQNPRWRNSFEFMDRYSATAPVGSYKPNPFGIYDMMGNVAEMCRDGYEPNFYENMATRDPFNDIETRGAAWKSMRGGSFLTYKPIELRSSYRGRLSTRHAIEYVGFRVVCESY
ncbi:MAG: SUMF1/EgtB/PvdO family nonheme iron enzyme [Candidatus Sumerlaeia bacterium]